MKEYNDYIEMTFGYLKNYNKFLIVIKNLEAEKEAKRLLLADQSVAIAKYGDTPAGGSSELNQTEAAASKRMELEEEIDRIDREIAELHRILNKVDNAICGLDSDDRKLMEMYYMDRRSWGEIADELYCSADWARKRGKKAVAEVAFMIFGQKACPTQLSFCFCG